jgi:glycosyltransferase involved in cell wall biosynthesis
VAYVVIYFFNAGLFKLVEAAGAGPLLTQAPCLPVVAVFSFLVFKFPVFWGPMKTISIVTPCFNEEASIRECYETIRRVMDSQLPGYGREHIFCDNCSTDRTVEILREIAAQDPSVKVIVNARNFGILRNNYNGVLAATGDAVVLFMPVDMQDPPDLIPEFVKHWESGIEIVYGIRAEREEPFLLRNARKAFYQVLSRLSYVNYPPNVGDFQLADRKVVEAMKRIDDAQPFVRMMPFEVGFRSVGIAYTWRARRHGVSRNAFLNMIDQGLNGLISFSNTPVRIALWTGMAISLASFLYTIGVFLATFFGFVIAGHGIPTVILAVFFFGGMQLLFLGVIGEYILAIFNQVRRRPIVFERERINFDGPSPNAPADPNR